MSISAKNILLYIFSLFISFHITAQIGSYTNGASLEAHFLRNKIETQANTSIFNLLTIKNRTNKRFIGSVRYIAPNGWSILGESNIKIDIPAKDSLTLPVRVSVSNKVVGEIGYALIATVFDKQERQIISEYSFIVIPRIADIKTKLLNRTTYFDNKTAKAKIYYKIENNGNTNEVVQLEIDGHNMLRINDAKVKDIYAKEISLPPHSDTIIDFNVQYDPDIDLRKYYFVEVKVYNSDTTFKNIVWANRIESEYTYLVPEYSKCGIFQLVFNNLLQEDPSISFYARGNILFKKNLTAYYEIRPPTWTKSRQVYDYFESSAMYYAGLRNNIFDIRVGSLYNKFKQRYYGLGASLDLNLKSVLTSGFYMINKYSDFYGAELGFQTKKNFMLKAGYSEINYDSLFRFHQSVHFDTRFRLGRNHSFYLFLGGSQTDDLLTPNYEKYNYGVNFRYSGNFNKLRINLTGDYGTPQYTGTSAGRFYINGKSEYLLNKKNRFNLYYIKQDYFPALYSLGTLQPIRYKYYDDIKLEHAVNIDKTTDFYYGLNYIQEKTNQIIAPSGTFEPFLTDNYRLFVKAVVRVKYKNIQITPHFDFGRVYVNPAYDFANTANLSTFTYNFYFNVTARRSGLLLFYRNGPFQIYEQYYFYLNNYFTKRLFITAYYDKYILNKLLLLNLRANYQSNLGDNTNLFNLSAQFTWFLPHDWSVYLLSNYSLRTLQDERTKAMLKYSTGYMEIGIRKELNCKQPRIQFYDLKVVFFRDLNGNRKKESNEPGISSVLAKVKIDQDNIVTESSSQFVSIDLMSDAKGEIEYKNIPNGNYILNYQLLGNIIGNFSRENLETPFSINEDKIIYIPYLENNRIIGKIILNRDPLSALGTIDLGNIRVVAEDTKGNTFSALTDNQGNFVLYTPVADHYVVKINNVFYESFDLQQPEFIVKFNGYKQFEVTFVFNEKKRKINFDNQITEEPDIEDIQLIRKTTLTGKIRDAISLEPVEAEIKIIDNKTNKEVSRAISNKITGNYSISYVAGPHYRMEIVANGYWEHVENLYIEQVISIQNINKDIMLNKLGENPEEQKTYIIYKKEEDFTENFKQGQQIPINYLNFDLKQTRLNPEAYPELDRLIELLNKNKTVNIEIAGYSDDQSNDRVEKIIALRRAKAVAKYLTMHGLNENRITVKSYGNSRPLVPGANEKARKKNRRVEIIVR